MAKVRVDIDDLISTWKDKTNDISNQMGDLAALRTIEDSDLVGAINEIWGLARLDSAGIIELLQPQLDSIQDQLDSGLVTPNSITSVELAGPESLLLLDSNGVVVKTIYGANA